MTILKSRLRRRLTMHRASAGVLLIAGAMWGGACDPGRLRGSGTPCTLDQNCGPSFFCSDHSCRAPAGGLPTVKFVTPGSGAFVAAPVEIMAEVISADPIVSVELFAGDMTVDPEDGNALHFTWSDAPAGSQQLKLLATDKWSRVAEAEIAVTVEVQPPVVTIVRPTATDRLQGDVEIEAGVGDEPDPVQVDASLLSEGTVLADLGTKQAPPFMFIWPSGSYAPGTYVIAVTAVDAAGLQGQASLTVIRRADVGTACGVDDDCQSGFCTDGVCCVERCDESCRTCANAPQVGTCVGVVSRDDPDTCHDADVCDDQANCVPATDVTGQFPGCSAAQTALVLQAGAIARNLLGAQMNDLLACLTDAFLWIVPPEAAGIGVYPERLLSQAAAAQPVVISCQELGVPGHNDGVLIDPLGLQVTFDPDLLALGDVNDTAAEILHAAAHAEGYIHPISADAQDANYAVCNQVRLCSAQLASGETPAIAFGPQRSQLPAETVLGAVGTDGGFPATSSDCPPDGFGSGIYGNSSYRVASLGLVCSGDQLGSAPLAAEGDPFLEDCAAGELLVGLYGFADQGLNGVGALCADEGSVQALATPLVVATGDLKGGTDGAAWTRQCPPGMAVKSLRLRWDLAIDRVDVVCQAVAQPLDVSALAVGSLGEMLGASVYDDSCAGQAIIEAVATRLSPGGELSRLGGTCRNVTRLDAGAVTLGTIETPLPSRGGSTQGLDAVDACPAGGALVGLRAGDDGSDAGIRSLQVLCTPDAAAWAQGMPVPWVEGPLRGDSTIPLNEAACPSGTFVSGWSLSLDQFIDTLTLVCRQL